MARSGFLLAASLVIVCSVHAPARANDSAFGGHGSDLAPIAERRIRMASERIEIELVADRAAGDSGGEKAWRIQATYRFVNPTSERIEIQMGFPEVRCDDSESDCVGRGGVFRNMRTTVRGEVVRHRFGEVTRHPEWPELGRVFLYDVVFEPNETIEIVHRYVHDRTFVAAGMAEELHYLTRTGASWNGPIGEAEFIVRVPYVPRGVAAHRDYPVERRLIRENGVPRGVALRSSVRDLRPTNDFFVVFLGQDGVGPPQLGATDCPMIEDLADASADEARLALTNVATESLRTCAAALDTQYGADPGTEAAALERARTSPDALAMLMDGFVVVPPHALPEYDPSWLPAPERAYVEALRAEATRRGSEAPPMAAPAPPPTAPPVAAPVSPAAPAAPATTGTAGGCACNALAVTRAPRGSAWLALLVASFVVRPPCRKSSNKWLGRSARWRRLNHRVRVRAT